MSKKKRKKGEDDPKNFEQVWGKLPGDEFPPGAEERLRSHVKRITQKIRGQTRKIEFMVKRIISQKIRVWEIGLLFAEEMQPFEVEKPHQERDGQKKGEERGVSNICWKQ